MSTILEETEAAIGFAGFTLADIVFIGSYDGEYGCTWEEFKALAKKDEKNYYSGYGGQTLATDLTIIFKDNSYLERREYDGAEGWRYIPNIQIKPSNKKITSIANGESWASLAEMNRPGGKYAKPESIEVNNE